MSYLRIGVLSLIATGVAMAQAPAPVEFEVASIRASQPLDATNFSNIGLHVDGAMVRIAAISLHDYVGMAFKVKDYQIAGPDFLRSQRFDINGKIPQGAKIDQVGEMLQSLLTQRFHMKIHHEMRDVPVMALVLAKSGLKLKESAPDDFPTDGKTVNVTVGLDANRGVGINLGGGSSYTMGDDKLEGKKLDMTRLADILTRFVDKPVVDLTKTPGFYDITIKMPQEEFVMLKIRSAVASGITLPPQAMALLDHAPDPVGSLDNALQAAGLRLEARKMPYDVIVIDSFDKTPTDN